VPARAAPANIPPTAAGGSGVDPEQAFVASLSSCHMLWFLHLACRAGHVVERYVDEASGTLGKAADGRMAMTRVTLNPVVAFAGEPPSAEAYAALHETAHEHCFIANSVTSKIVVSPRIARS
jgi:organic hydroperoxide reductase OsmC/OhrA